jgi:NADPH-dependent 2,4-dienoyl-CoA reductase/sulfur reductase-like enzyme
MEGMRLLIVGGSDAGVSAALRARELHPDAEVTVLVADEYPNFSICGLPFLFSGEVSDWRTLAHRTLAELTASGASFLTRTRAERIELAESRVEAMGDGGRVSFGYDRLIIATGARPVRPPISGIDLEGVHLLRDMGDAFALERRLAETRARSVLIVGGGYIGMEMADALRYSGFDVTVAERSEAPMPSLDPELGALVERALEAGGTRVVNKTTVRQIERRGEVLIVRGDPDFEAAADVVLIASGVTPNAKLGIDAGLALGERGAIRVNRRMETSTANVYAAGDCGETWHRLFRRSTYLPLGTTAHKQGRVAGENAVGGAAEFAGSLGTQVVKLFDKVVGRTGLSHAEALREGFTPLTVQAETHDHKTYLPGAKTLHVRITGDSRDGRLLGAQIFGEYGAEISKRLDVIATAIHHRMRVIALNDLDLSYTPPLGSPWDPVQAAAQQWERALRRE